MREFMERRYHHRFLTGSVQINLPVVQKPVRLETVGIEKLHICFKLFPEKIPDGFLSLVCRFRCPDRYRLSVFPLKRTVQRVDAPGGLRFLLFARQFLFKLMIQLGIRVPVFPSFLFRQCVVQHILCVFTDIDIHFSGSFRVPDGVLCNPDPLADFPDMLGCKTAELLRFFHRGIIESEKVRVGIGCPVRPGKKLKIPFELRVAHIFFDGCRDPGGFQSFVFPGDVCNYRCGSGRNGPVFDKRK